MTKTKRCPICREQYLLISDSEKVCQAHESWYVTICRDYGKTTFSNAIGCCMKCTTRGDRLRGPKGLSKDHRAALRDYGQDSW